MSPEEIAPKKRSTTKEPTTPKARKVKKATTPDDPKAVATVDAIKRIQKRHLDVETGQAPQMSPSIQEPVEHPLSISMISQESFEEQIEDLRGSNAIRNDKDEKIRFEGEIKEQFIQFFEEAYPIAAKMVMIMTEVGRFLDKVQRALKPRKLFLTWMRRTGFPERNSYNYIHVYQRFGEKLPQFSYLGIRELLAASHLEDCAEYVEKHQQLIAKKTTEEFEKEVRNRVQESKKKRKGGRGRTPSHITIGECKVRPSGDGTRISVDGLSKNRQTALLEAIKVWLSQDIT
jgi:hypothetical protein